MINEICPECDLCFSPPFGRAGACPGCGLRFAWDFSEAPPSLLWADEDDCDCDEDDDGELDFD